MNRQNAEFSDSRVKGVARALRIAVRAAYKVTLAGRHYSFAVHAVGTRDSYDYRLLDNRTKRGRGARWVLI